MNLEILVDILAIIVIAMKVVDALFKPLFLKLKIDFWWLLYVGIAVGALIGWGSGLNAFPAIKAYPWVGQLLTICLCGAGPSVLYDRLDKGDIARLPRNP